MNSSSFVNCNFRNAEMKCSNLSYSNLRNTKLIMVDSIMCKYEGANLSNAMIHFSYFEGVNFRMADLTGANLREVSFRFSDLRGAIMKCEGLETCMFENVIYDKDTIWQDNFNPIEQGVILV